MEALVKFLMYLLQQEGIWAVILFLLAAALPLALIGFIIFSWSSSGQAIDEKIARRVQIEKETHKVGNRLRKQFSEEVIVLLQDVAINACADRALVFEYSNGTSNLAGLPFLFASAAAEVTSTGTSPVALQYQRINLSLIAKFLTQLEKDGYIFIEDLKEVKEEYPVLYAFMEPNNVKSAIFYAIHGVDEVVGFIVATTIHEKILCKKDSLHEVAKAAQIISSMWNFDNLDNKLHEKKWLKWPF